MTPLKRAAELRREKVRLEAELKKVNTELEMISPAVLDWFAENGVDRITVDGLTLYQRRELWPRIAEGHNPEELRDVLASLGIDASSIVKLSANANTLRSLVTEMEASDEGIPDSLRAVLNIAEAFKLGFRENGK